MILEIIIKEFQMNLLMNLLIIQMYILLFKMNPIDILVNIINGKKIIKNEIEINEDVKYFNKIVEKLEIKKDKIYYHPIHAIEVIDYVYNYY